MYLLRLEKPKLVRMTNNPLEIPKLVRQTNSPEEFFEFFPELKERYQTDTQNSFSFFLLEKPKLVRQTNNPLEIPKLVRQTNSHTECFVYFQHLENIYENNNLKDHLLNYCFLDNDSNISK